MRLVAARVLAEAEIRHRHVEELVEEATAGQDGATVDWSLPDRRRLRELVFGVSRLRHRYEHLVDRHRHKRGRIDPRLRAVLHVALHEICETRTPDFASVDEAVRSARAQGLRWAEGFVNGLLRAVLREGPSAGFPDAQSDPVGYAEAWLSFPRWLVERWHARLGAAAMLDLCAAQNRRPPLVLRAEPGRRPELLAALAAVEWEARAMDLAPDAVEMVTRVPPAVLLETIEQAAVVQDAAAQLVAPLLLQSSDLEAPSRWIDLCAAPGGKAVQLAQLGGRRARVVALDLAADRLTRLKPTLARLGLSARVDCAVGDGRRPPLVDGAADGVLVDAPCTGTGVLARRHEARWLRRPEDLRALPLLQIELVHRALDLVRPGGIVVYSTCSLEPEENDEVVDRVLADREDVEELGVDVQLGSARTERGRLQTWPHVHGADGAFAARLRRRPVETGDVR